MLHLSSNWISRCASRIAVTPAGVAIESTSDRVYEPLNIAALDSADTVNSSDTNVLVLYPNVLNIDNIQNFFQEMIGPFIFNFNKFYKI